MKPLLMITALLEGGTGVALLVAPSVPVSVLLGSALDSPVVAVIGRLAGVALLALGTACWLARNDTGGSAARGLVTAMLLYNAGVAAVLVYACLGVGLCGIGLWPVVGLHAVMGAWCATGARRKTS
jgi:hypothetical protein